MYSQTHHRPDGDSRNSPELKQESSNSSATTELPVSFSISTLRDNKIDNQAAAYCHITYIRHQKVPEIKSNQEQLACLIA